MKAIITGATGLTGSFLLQNLLKNEHFSTVQYLVRRKSGISHPKLEETVIDFDKLNASMLHEADVLFCCLGTTMKKAGSKEKFKKVDYEYVVRLAKFCEEKGIKKFLVISAMGANASSSIFYNRVKGEMEKAVSEMKIPSVHIFRPSILTGPREELRWGEKLGIFGAQLFSPLMIGPVKKYRAIKAEMVAKAMINASKNEQDGVSFHLSDEIKKIGTGSFN